MQKVAIIGLGYVGLPLALLCAKKGIKTVGFDINQKKVDMIKEGRMPFKEEMYSLDDDSVKKNFSATTKKDALDDCNTYIVCVPTPVDNRKKPDFKPLVGASWMLKDKVKKGDLVVIESTVFPGTCEEIVIPVLEDSGLKAGIDFYFAHCPERVNPGDAFWHVGNIPRVVGGLTEKCTDKTSEFYEQILDGSVFDVKTVKDSLRPKFQKTQEGYKKKMIPLGSITKMASLKDAEAVKAMENTVRDVNIAFVNELAKISHVLGLNVVDIVEGMSTKPFGKGPFYPGIGVGGHCIAVDPEWLKDASIKAGYYPEMITLARETNNSMPEYAVSLLEDELESLKKRKIAILGVSYKGNIDDPRESPFYEVKKLLLGREANISIFDPYFKAENTCDSLSECVDGCIAVVLVTDHKEFVDTVDGEFLKSCGVSVIVDGRNCLDKKDILKNDVRYEGIGK